MKTIIASFVLLIFSCSYSLAGDCKILDFMKEGAKVEVWMFGGSHTMTIEEIDVDKCYFRGDNSYWYNINNILLIKPL